MSVKHGNWNAYQKTDEEILKDELDRLAVRVGGALVCARKMFEVLNTSDLNAEQLSAAVEILSILHRRLGKA